MKTCIILAAIALNYFFTHKNQISIMATLAEVQEAVVALQNTVDTTQAAIAAAILALQEQIASGATPEQLQGVVDSLQAVSTDVSSTPTA